MLVLQKLMKEALAQYEDDISQGRDPSGSFESLKILAEQVEALKVLKSEQEKIYNDYRSLPQDESDLYHAPASVYNAIRLTHGH